MTLNTKKIYVQVTDLTEPIITIIITNFTIPVSNIFLKCLIKFDFHFIFLIPTNTAAGIAAYIPIFRKIKLIPYTNADCSEFIST